MEIERKFLVKQEETIHNECIAVQKISQGYISVNPEIRIRQKNNQYFLTFKGDGSLCREEFETLITKEQYKNLLPKIEGNLIQKSRHLLNIGNNLVAELDIYKNRLSPLCVVEVEFETESQAQSFIPPAWFGKEVTDNKSFKNKNLAFITDTVLKKRKM